MIYVILGTTASGKTSLASEIARKYDMPLIGADAYQIYSELALGSAAPSEEELKGITHHLIKDHSIKNPINVASYQKECRAILDHYQKLGKDVVISGGTFLYVKAALFAYDFPVEENLDSSKYEKLDPIEAYELLKSRNEEVANKIHPNNNRRVIRVLINLDQKKDMEYHANTLLYPAVFFSIDSDIEEVNEKIVKRVDMMIEKGLIEEAKEIFKDPLNLTTAMEAIGYKEVNEGIKNNKSVDKIREDIIIHTRRYAKRQRTFLRHQFNSLHTLSPEKILEQIDFIKEKSKRSRALLGEEDYLKICSKKVMVIGLGGVGGMLCVGLARLGVHFITLIDNDSVSASNLNRQMLYTFEDVGKSKYECASSALNKIDPYLTINGEKSRVTEENIKELILKYKPEVIFDCIDDVKAKAALVEESIKNNILLFSSGGMGKRIDSTRVTYGYYGDTGEPLVKATKRRLKENQIDSSNIKTVYSKEPAMEIKSEDIASIVTVPNAAGLTLLTYFIKSITGR